ncbi:MAG: hypothetical protein WCJ85_00590 [Chitinophagaceae bacterium]
MKYPFLLRHSFLTILLLLITSYSATLLAQQNHFIYIQTENKQPFYVKLDRKIFSSSGSGYLIIPKLSDGNYNLAIGFPKNEWPEQLVSCSIDKKDLGFNLKNFGEKGWGLFNLQSLELVMATNSSNANNAKKEIVEDPFNSMLSNAVNDPSIKEKPMASPTITQEKSVLVDKNPIEMPVENSKEIPVPAKNKIFRIIYNSNQEGTELVYVDLNEGMADTIRILIPAELKSEVIALSPTNPDSLTKTPPIPAVEQKTNEPALAISKEAPAQNSRFIDMVMPNPNATVAPVKMDSTQIQNNAVLPITPLEISSTVSTSSTILIIPNSDCKNFAKEEDFLKLRKKMAAANNEDDMIIAAKKIFKTKCFTTDQIKNLSVLFLKDKGRYDFFDAAYPFVSDTALFPSLESQLTDPYFINRFKVMIRH